MAHPAGGDLRERGHAQQARKALTAAYDELVGIGTSTRVAAALTGLARATQDRRRSVVLVAPPTITPAAAPSNKLTDEEELQVLAVLNFLPTIQALGLVTLAPRRDRLP